jgi:hypothetical protein
MGGDWLIMQQQVSCSQSVYILTRLTNLVKKASPFGGNA